MTWILIFACITSLEMAFVESQSLKTCYDEGVWRERHEVWKNVTHICQCAKSDRLGLTVNVWAAKCHYRGCLTIDKKFVPARVVTRKSFPFYDQVCICTPYMTQKQVFEYTWECYLFSHK